MSDSQDENILLHPERIWSEGKAKVMDVVSYALPCLAAVLGVGSGIAVLMTADKWAAFQTILGAVASAGGILVTGMTSRNRDRQIAAAHQAGWLAMQIAERNSDHSNIN